MVDTLKKTIKKEIAPALEHVSIIYPMIWKVGA
jgi:hypothetical protein